MKQPPISASVVVLSYNYDRFLKQAIDSALGQTHPNVEVIVVDDGSQDTSREIIASYGDRIRPLLKENGGQGSACNAGFSIASGEAIFFLDADDAMLPETVATVLAAWQANVVMVQYRLAVVDSEGRHVGIYPEPWRQLVQGDVSEQLLTTGGFAMSVTSGLAFSRETLQNVMPLPEAVRYAADGCLARAAALFGLVQRIDRPLALYRRHGGNDSDSSASHGELAAFFRKKLSYTRNEHQFLRNVAERLGLSYAADLGERDSDYLNFRLLSLSLDPAGHPLPDDAKLDLLVRYLKIRCFESDPASRRFADLVTAIGLSVLHGEARSTLVRWRHEPQSRPRWLRRIGTLVRQSRCNSEPNTSPWALRLVPDLP